MADVTDQPHPLVGPTLTERAHYWLDHAPCENIADGITHELIATLVATVEAQATELADAHAAIQVAAWQFNEAVSLLREARRHLDPVCSTAEDIDDGLPAIQEALVSLATAASAGEVAQIRQARETSHE